MNVSRILSIGLAASASFVAHAQSAPTTYSITEGGASTTINLNRLMLAAPTNAAPTVSSGTSGAGIAAVEVAPVVVAAADPVSVPEPASLGVLAAGAFGLGLVRRRRD